MSGGRVAAVVAPDSIPAVTEQTRAPDHVFSGRTGLERALATKTEWIWVLADGGDPAPDALQQLLGAREPDGEERASLLAGMAIEYTGCALDGHVPTGDSRKLDDVVRLTAKALLPIRDATFTNCLIARDCFVLHGLPDRRRFGRYAPVEWSARALRERTGYFVPASIVRLERRLDRRAALTAIPSLAQVLRTGVWTRGEAIGEVATLASILAGTTRE